MEIISLPSKLPLDLDCYQSMLPLFQRALGIYFFSDYYVAREDVYKGQKVYFSRFVYDLISMFGLHLFYIELQTLEMLLRRVYGVVTHNFAAGKVYLVRVEDVRPAFTEKELMEASDLQGKEDARINKLHLSISDKRINRDGSNMVIGVGDSVEDPSPARRGTRGQDGDEDEEDHESDNNRELFSGLLGTGDEDALQV